MFSTVCITQILTHGVGVMIGGPLASLVLDPKSETSADAEFVDSCSSPRRANRGALLSTNI